MILKADPSGCIERFLNKLPPGQTRIYCKVIPERLQMKGDKRLFYPQNCLGKDKNLALFRKGARIMGLSNPDKFMPHTLRHMLGTHLANDPNACLKECLLTMRHKSAAATLNYQANNIASEENRLLALGYRPPEQDNEEVISSQGHSLPSDTSTFDRSFPNDETSTIMTSYKTPTSTVLSSNIVTDLSSCAKLPSKEVTVLTQPDFDEDILTSSYAQQLNDTPCTQNAIDIVKKEKCEIETTS